MKITSKEIRDMVREAIRSMVKEADESKKVDKANSMVEKCVKCLMDCAESMKKCADECEEALLKEEDKNSKATITQCVGVMKKVHGVAVTACEWLKKNSV